MKTIAVRLVLAFAFGLQLNASAATIAHWNFNSTPPDSSTSTGSLVPSAGTGTASLVGNVSSGFAAGSTNDPASSDNTGWNTSSYPSQGNGNKSSGIQLSVSTRGFSNIVVNFDQRPSGTASRYYRFQYSVNGTDFIDHAVINLPGPANGPFFSQSVALGAVPETADNPNLIVRIVSEFESTATGSGVSGYVTASASSYSASGTVRFDVVTVSGNLIDEANLPPSISAIPDQSILENSDTGDLPFVISDLETPADQLILAPASSNTNLVPTQNIVITTTAEGKAVRVTPALDQFGSATITLVVMDLGGLSATNAFVLTVVPLNASPTITAIPHQSTLVSTPTAPIPFTVADLETAGDALVVTASSSNPSLVPVANIAITPTGSSRSLTATPVAGQLGTAVITVTVTDTGGRSASTRFNLMVLPTSTTLLYETFGYPAGPLTTNSALLWATHDGIAGQTLVSDEAATLQSSRSEDSHAPLLGSPYPVGSNTVLYASLQVYFVGLPSAGGQFFAHFRNATTAFRGRLFAATADATTPNTFRLGIANSGSSPNVQIATDLNLSNTYTAVIRYNLDTGASTLWVNPSAESDPGVTATDTVTPSVVTDFAFRQSAGIGNISVDNIKVATTFADVAGSGGFRLRIQAVNDTIEVSWPKAAATAGYRLQSNLNLDPSGWVDATEVPIEVGADLVVRLAGGSATGNRFFRLAQ